ncbi:hypothetical protein BWQ96_07638 [Gracilariopsis chorda]|uniref:NAD(P)-binding domain-containing protein n=1 Tax=Gracilariopsis chorda TaxID=448386 RepID=A0A2V3IKK9_9FLOR|nr:hypothetical protein BWQ96_07638 [Gracilariopsis chorda]|eukprot:PXF42634.1 hypothetical protein BWQ96_07638 [Gracilariopsis chorda]
MCPSQYNHAFLPSPTLPTLPTLPKRRHPSHTRTPPQCSRLKGTTILVTGATGPTGRLICAALAARDASVRALVRPKTYLHARQRVNSLLQICPSAQIVMADLRDERTLRKAVSACHGVISASGTRNFDPADPNRPELVDFKGIQLLSQCFFDALLEHDLTIMFSDDAHRAEHPFNQTVHSHQQRPITTATQNQLLDPSRFVLLSSLGVTRPEAFPHLQQMNSLLTYKLCGEDALRESGCSFTIVRPGALVDVEPRQTPIILDQGDRIAGSISRADVAHICAEAIFRPTATNVTFECVATPPALTQPSSEKRFSPHMFEHLVPEELHY